MNHDDDSWDQLLARLAHAEADLGAAEAELQTAAPAPLPPGFVDAAVAAARAAPRPRRRPVRLFVVPGLLVLAAATTLSLLWPQAHDSQATMSYPLAVELLLRLDQPSEHRQSAATLVDDRLCFGVDALQHLRDAGDAPAALRADAREHLARLARALDLPDLPLPRPPFADLAPLAAAAANASLPLPARLQAARDLALQTMSGLRALHVSCRVDPELRDECAIYLEHTRAQLRQ
jgi:hypothetical protein